MFELLDRRVLELTCGIVNGHSALADLWIETMNCIPTCSIAPIRKRNKNPAIQITANGFLPLLYFIELEPIVGSVSSFVIPKQYHQAPVVV